MDIDRLAHDGVSGRLPGACAVGLALLRTVNAIKADFYLPVVGVKHGDCVAVGDGDDAGLVGGRGGRGGKSQGYDSKRDVDNGRKSLYNAHTLLKDYVYE